ncbi:MAG: GNAT family N-acetyltransferase, partial [Ktedonobacteraceae bacterium]|nr:GNAT family N-acetyltransferase [Ktedonobacteraceae bacterium]
LIRSLRVLLPRQLYVHLSPGVEQAFSGSYHLESHGLHYKMALRHPAALNAIDTEHVIQLSTADRAEVEEFYRVSYPNNSFDPRMLETECYYGIRQQGKLVSIAGIHVYSPRYRVAALGNVTTHPNRRGQGLGRTVCASLSQALYATVDHIGLNVKADNTSAIACYKRLGFEIIAEYTEFTCTLQR